jgi:hypothetical protein
MSANEKILLRDFFDKQLNEIVDDCAFSLVHNEVGIIDLKGFYKELHKKVKAHIKSELEDYIDIDKVKIEEHRKHILTIKEVK